MTYIGQSDTFKMGIVLLQASLLRPMPLQYYDPIRNKIKHRNLL